MKKIEADVKLHNKPFEDMELTELYAERSARNWHRSRMKRSIELLKKRKWWLEENMPIYSDEEIKRQYEDGEITKNQYKTAHGRRKMAINNRMKNADRMVYAERLVYHEEALIAYIDDLIAEKLAKKAASAEIAKKQRQQRRMSANRKHNPRKKTSKYNPPSKLDPIRKWKTRDVKPMPELQGARARWKHGKSDDKKPLMVMKRMQPIVTWDVEILMTIARDRGFFTEVAVVAAIAEALNMTVSGTKKMIESGKLTWSQCIIIGAIFEMTPKEFCDTFLAGYFKEVADGVFRAQVDDIDNLLDIPYLAKPNITEEGDTEEDGI
jgi:hypothetical protein